MLISLPELESTLAGLSSSRPVFHSEADFQHALAWELHHAHPDVSVRLEYKPVASERVYIDIRLPSPVPLLGSSLRLRSCRSLTRLNYLEALRDVVE